MCMWRCMCVEKKWGKFSDNICFLFLIIPQRFFFFLITEVNAKKEALNQIFTGPGGGVMPLSGLCNLCEL